jgi:hypothetical protein
MAIARGQVRTGRPEEKVQTVERRVVDGRLGGKDALHAQQANDLNLLHSHTQKRQIDVSSYPQYTRGANRTHVS